MATLLIASRLALAEPVAQDPNAGRASAPPQDKELVFDFLTQLDDYYRDGEEAATIRERARNAGIADEVLEPFLDYIGPDRAISDDFPEAGDGLKNLGAVAAGEVLSRFGDADGSAVVAALALTTGPAAQRAMLKLSHDLADLLPQAALSAAPEPTGDALYDAYAAAVDERMRAVPSGGVGSEDEAYLEINSCAALPEELLAAWEPRFGDDPRYWELRYMCCGDGQDYLGGPQVAPENERLRFLQTAVDKGIARPATYMALFMEHRIRREDALREMNMAAAQDSETLREPSLPLDAEELALLDRMDGAAPQAWALYIRALDSGLQGDAAHAATLLARANALAEQRYPLAFPFDVIDCCADPGLPPGGPAVCGAISLHYSRSNLFLGFGDLGRALVAEAQSSGNWELLRAYDEAMSRQRQQPHVFAAVIWPVPLSAGHIARRAVEQNTAASWSSAQQDAMRRRAAALELAQQTIAMSFARHSYSLETGPILAGAFGKRGAFIGQWLDHLVEYDAERAALPYLKAAGGSPLPDLPNSAELAAYPLFIAPASNPAQKAARQAAQLLTLCVSSRAYELLDEKGLIQY